MASGAAYERNHPANPSGFNPYDYAPNLNADLATMRKNRKGKKSRKQARKRKTR